MAHSEATGLSAERMLYHVRTTTTPRRVLFGDGLRLLHPPFGERERAGFSSVLAISAPFSKRALEGREDAHPRAKAASTGVPPTGDREREAKTRNQRKSVLSHKGEDKRRRTDRQTSEREERLSELLLSFSLPLASHESDQAVVTLGVWLSAGVGWLVAPSSCVLLLPLLVSNFPRTERESTSPKWPNIRYTHTDKKTFCSVITGRGKEKGKSVMSL